MPGESTIILGIEIPSTSPTFLTVVGFHIAVGLAAIPEKIRGFGHVKARHIKAAKADEAALLDQLRSGAAPFLKAAE